jgi:hypothetical protein
MKEKTIICGICLALASGVLADGISVSLLTSEKMVLWGEKTLLKVVVSNGTAFSVNVYSDGVEAEESQLMWREVSDVLSPSPCFALPESRVVELIRRSGQAPLLAPTEIRVWDFEEWGLPGFPRFSGEKHIFTQVLVNPGTWVSSNTNLVRIASQRYEEGLLRLISAYIGLSDTLVPFKVYEHTLDGERFLFTRCERVCQIPDSAVPTFAVNTNTAVMTVSFGASAPPVNYNVKTGQIVP